MAITSPDDAPRSTKAQQARDCVPGLPGSGTEGLDPLGWGAYRKAVLARGGEPLQALVDEAVHELSTPIQFLCLDLIFLRQAYACLGAHLGDPQAGCEPQVEASPPEAARAQAERDLDYFRTETPQVLEDVEAGLAILARVVNAMRNLAREARPGDGGGSHGTRT